MQTNDVIELAPSLYKKVLKLMGNRFEITVTSDDTTWADECITEAAEEIRRIEKLFTTFDDSSQTNLINRNAGITPVKVDREVFDLVERSKKISALTQGAFDITYGSIDKRLWNFDKTMTSLPDPSDCKTIGSPDQLPECNTGRKELHRFPERKRNENWFWWDRKRLCRRKGQISLAAKGCEKRHCKCSR